MPADLRAAAEALCEWEAAQNHLAWCAVRTSSYPEFEMCNCSYAHRLEVIGCQLADALRAFLAAPEPSAPSVTSNVCRCAGQPPILVSACPDCGGARYAVEAREPSDEEVARALATPHHAGILDEWNIANARKAVATFRAATDRARKEKT